MKPTFKFLVALIAILCFSMNSMAGNTLPLRGTVVKPSDPNIQYIGRVSFANPDSPSFSWPGIQIWASFEGTSLK
ncbi:MAG: lipase, partial [Prevotella sp.]|nr:lipase [Prevotella sp.]